MALPEKVDAVKNERTEKLFIVLDWNAGDNKVKVINPTGDVLDVVCLIFKMDEPLVVASSGYKTSFSEAQLNKLEKWESEKYIYEEKKRLERSARASQKPTSTKASSTRTKTSVARKEGIVDRKASTSGRRPSAHWEATDLVFYRHRIDMLKPNDIFAISIENVGVFQITKADFQRVFNNVVMNPEYRTQGTFRYLEIPEVAMPYIGQKA
jgi:hypothetical protein